MSKYISSPRPVWADLEVKDVDRVITLGSNTAGIFLRMTKEGIYINGYYAGLTETKKFANLRDPLFIPWEDFDKMRYDTMRGKPRDKKIAEGNPDREDVPDKEYLEKLPIVTLNGMNFYIDIDRQERRPVEAPHRVFNFKKQAGQEAE